MVRLIVFTLIVSTITLVGIGWVLTEKLFTNMAIPGWATSAIGVLTIILVQALMFFAISAFNLMNNRINRAVIPRLDSPSFVLSRQNIVARRGTGAVRVANHYRDSAKLPAVITTAKIPDVMGSKA
jgi:hypothetical protein